MVTGSVAIMALRCRAEPGGLRSQPLTMRARTGVVKGSADIESDGGNLGPERPQPVTVVARPPQHGDAKTRNQLEETR